ncbi:MAG: 1-acyl-sn-glycerol-3-phosphate acyltransferase [Bacteroidota bacterium]
MILTLFHKINIFAIVSYFNFAAIINEMGFISKSILKVFGWKALYTVKEPLDTYIIIVAPHTSFWDFIIGRLTMSALNLHGKFLIKKEMFKFPVKQLLKWAGGIPVDRGQGSNVIKPVVELLKKSHNFGIVITPEGTRKYTTKWKKGYYFIAHAANVPIALGYVDYAEKVCCVADVLHTTGNYEADFEIIQDFYRDRVARHPERFNLS